MDMSLKKSFFLIISLLIIQSSCKVNYSMSGASIPPEVKTIVIKYFNKTAALGPPSMSQTFTERLKDKFLTQTNLAIVNSSGDLTLYVTDKDEKPVDTTDGRAEAQVLIAGKNYTVALAPAGGNTLKGAGPFTGGKGMRVIVKTTKVAGESFQARMTPLQ